jgi:hypothetical protein
LANNNGGLVLGLAVSSRSSAGDRASIYLRPAHAALSHGAQPLLKRAIPRRSFERLLYSLLEESSQVSGTKALQPNLLSLKLPISFDLT